MPSSSSPLVFKPLRFVVEENHNSAEIEIFFKTFNTPVATMPQISPISKWSCASCWLFLSLPKKPTFSSQNQQHLKQAWDELWASPLRCLHKESTPFVKKALEQLIPSSEDVGLSERQVEEILIALAKDNHFVKVVNEIMPVWLKERPQSPLLKKLPHHALQKASQTSTQGREAYQSQKTKSEGIKSHSEIIEILQHFHHEFFMRGYKNIDKGKIPSDFLIPQNLTASPINPLLIKKTQRSLSEYPHLIAPALVLLPLPFLKELDLPYSVLLHSSVPGDKGALSFLNPEMFNPIEQQKMMSFLLFQKIMLGFPETDAPYYEAMLEYGIENKIPVVGVKTLPSSASSYTISPSFLLQQGFGMVLRASVSRTRPPLLTKAKPLLRRVEKHCGVDPYFKGLVKFFYEKQNVKFPLEGPSALPSLPKDGFHPMPALRDEYKKSLDEEMLAKEQTKLKRATNKAKSKKPKTLSRKM